MSYIQYISYICKAVHRNNLPPWWSNLYSDAELTDLWIYCKDFIHLSYCKQKAVLGFFLLLHFIFENSKSHASHYNFLILGWCFHTHLYIYIKPGLSHPTLVLYIISLSNCSTADLLCVCSLCSGRWLLAPVWGNTVKHRHYSSLVRYIQYIYYSVGLQNFSRTQTCFLFVYLFVFYYSSTSVKCRSTFFLMDKSLIQSEKTA